MRKLKFFFCALSIFFVCPGNAQYKGIILPTSGGLGQAKSAGGGQITGIDFGLGNVVWSAPNYDHPVRLRSPGYTGAEVWDTDGGKQVGYARAGGRQHAVMWSGPGGPIVDLDRPDLFLSTICFGTDGVSQVGSGAPLENTPHAVLWRGTAESSVDLHPTGNSEAYDVWGKYQVGQINLNTPVIWSGTPESMRLLPLPRGRLLGSVHAIHGTQVVGGGGGALLWDADTLKLTVLGKGAAFDTNGIYQVGWMQPANTFSFVHVFPRAIRWSGTPNSGFDLHRFFPGFQETYALAIDDNGTIAGWGVDADNNVRAIAWIPVPEPSTFAAFAIGLFLFKALRRRQP